MDIRDTADTLTVAHSCLPHSTFTDVNLEAGRFENIKLTGATFSDVCLGNAQIQNGNLSGLSIADCNLSGMTINGIAVEDLLAAYEAHAAI